MPDWSYAETARATRTAHPSSLSEYRVGPRSEKLNQLAEQVERAIKLLQETMTEDYSYGYATPVAGVITRDIAEHG